MKIPLLDLKAQYLAIKPEVDKAIADVMESQHFILGPAVTACEAACAKYSSFPPPRTSPISATSSATVPNSA